MSKVISLIAIILVAYYWSHTQKLKQLATRAGRKRCEEAGVQFLDHTVVQSKLALSRDNKKRLRLQREYLFDFTSTGEHRYQGKILIQAGHVVASELEAFSIN
ncbi:DUF3301 domain-containing protein [Aliikangiella sp. IMCC44359]|uniref:DUF3301 domain-containing protein n=1 Tax=Aliikangiella sp. IMCC44359 TaxID=3459125 RepID=UPI00403B1064